MEQIRKRGRPKGSKNKVKIPSVVPGDASDEPKKKRGRPPKNEIFDEEDDGVPSDAIKYYQISTGNRIIGYCDKVWYPGIRSLMFWSKWDLAKAKQMDGFDYLDHLFKEVPKHGKNEVHIIKSI